MPRAARVMVFIAALLVPLFTLWFGLSLAWERWHFTDQRHASGAVVVEIRETYDTAANSGLEDKELFRAIRTTPDDFQTRHRLKWSFWPTVEYQTRNGSTIRAETGQPMSRYMDIGDRVLVRYDSRQAQNVLLYEGFWSLWLAPVCIAGLGLLFTSIICIFMGSLLRAR